jgi:hypothetical protein
MTNILDKFGTENLNRNFVFNKYIFSEKHVIYQIIWENMVQRERSQNIIQGVSKLVTQN